MPTRHILHTHTDTHTLTDTYSHLHRPSEKKREININLSRIFFNHIQSVCKCVLHYFTYLLVGGHDVLTGSKSGHQSYVEIWSSLTFWHIVRDGPAIWMKSAADVMAGDGLWSWQAGSEASQTQFNNAASWYMGYKDCVCTNAPTHVLKRWCLTLARRSLLDTLPVC